MVSSAGAPEKGNGHIIVTACVRDPDTFMKLSVYLIYGHTTNYGVRYICLT